MKDYLHNIVQYTYGLGVIDLVKVTGTDKETTIESISEDRTVIVQAKFNNPVPEFVGLFGMPNLGKLKTILGIEEYKEDAKLSITKRKDDQGNDLPDGIHFENKAGDFKNDYRFMVAHIISDKLKSVKMKQVKWNVEITPTVTSIQKMRFQASANSEETTFTVKTEGSKLKFFFGDHSTHAGDFVFADGITGTLSKAWPYPVAVIQSILSLPGDKELKISDEGVMQITVNTGIAVYDYKIPAQSK
jgi:hypothetical protein